MPGTQPELSLRINLIFSADLLPQNEGGLVTSFQQLAWFVDLISKLTCL